MGLTPREREIALLAAEGLTNRQIADRLYISHHTVRCALYSAMQKLPATPGRRTRTRLAVWLYRLEQEEASA